MQIDFHYYATYAMARCAGLTQEVAKRVATAAQFVDDNACPHDIEFPDGSSLSVEATALVEVGGEIRLKGLNRENVGWRIAIEKPSVDERNIQEIIEPGDMAIATSGDYRNYFERDGVRYSHIINPETGKPLHHKVVSVTVLNSSSMTADGLSTGLMVLGEEKGMEVANQHNIPVFMVVKTADGFKEVASEAFKPYLGK